MIPILVAILMTAAHSSGGAVQEHAPKILVDHGACPFECCQYGRWTTTKATPTFTAPSDRAMRVAILPSGTVVTALAGQVRTVGEPFVVFRNHGPYKPGDTLMVYTYYGEGAFLVWYKGRRFTEDLGFSPYGGTGGTRCTDKAYCWGTLSDKLESEWWAQVRLANGRVVWVRGSDDFQGQDACG